MGSAFAGEPREWFPTNEGPLLTFTLYDPRWVMHSPTERCDIECPHLVEKCKEMEVEYAVET